MEPSEQEKEKTIEENVTNEKENVQEQKGPQARVPEPEIPLILFDDKQQEEKKRKQAEEEDKIASISRFPILNVMKYGRRGNPHSRVLCLVQDGAEAKFVLYKPRALRKRPVSSPIHLRDIVDVRKGKMTKVFQRPVANTVDDNKCFSVVTTNRTLDVVVKSLEERDKAADMILEIYKKVTKEDLLVGVRVRRQSALLERQQFFDLVEKHLNALHLETKAIWLRGLNGLPAEMIDKDFPRLAKNFQIYRVTKKGPSTPGSASSSPDLMKVKEQLISLTTASPKSETNILNKNKKKTKTSL